MDGVITEPDSATSVVGSMRLNSAEHALLDYVEPARPAYDGPAGLDGEHSDSPDPASSNQALDTARSRPARKRARSDAAVRGNAWIQPYLRRLVGADLIAALLAALTAFVVRLPDGAGGTQFSRAYLPAAFLLPLCWVGALLAADAYDKRIFSLGPDEFQRTGRALVLLMAVVGFGSYALRVGVARGFVVIALPLAALLSLLVRFFLRKRLHRARTKGTVRTSVVAVGDAESVIELAEGIHREAYMGMHVVGACIPRDELADTDVLARLGDAGIAPLGDLDSVVTAVQRAKADSVAVACSPVMSPKRLRELSWALEPLDADLIVAPGLMEVAGPRLHIRPVIGLPLLQIEKPEFTGAKRLVKGLVDRSLAVVGLAALSPVLLALWVAVRCTSAGPAFFTQTRVGKDGREFRIWKFRSMFIDAEQRKAEFADTNDHVGVLFKMRTDPRVTSVGRFIRRYSLDELPQLFNVVNGTMSLVGPRPPLPEEVQQYAQHVHRRLLVRPGVTGLWQISGRSDLSWEETVRLDLRYVENWSLGWDAQILWKTAAAVARGHGAY